MSKKISQEFGVAPLPTPQNLPIPFSGNQTIATDAEFARGNLKSLIHVSKDAVDEMLEVARNSETPRAFEILATLLNTAADLNTRLLDTHEREMKVRAKEPSGEGEAAKTVNNNTIVFSGTTAELNDLIMKRMKQ